ncbi:MAG: hypothetical protein ACI35R_13975, partial [Bacillus sp. (in: firmicutes)]
RFHCCVEVGVLVPVKRDKACYERIPAARGHNAAGMGSVFNGPLLGLIQAPSLSMSAAIDWILSRKRRWAE